MSNSPEQISDFQERRRKGIGASDTAAILGLSDWGNAYTVAAEKILGVFQPETEQMLWGKLHEPILLDQFRKRTGLPCVPGVPFQTSKRLPEFLFANCDGVQREKNPEYVVEAKQSRFGDGFGPDGTDEIPDLYNIQMHQQMVIVGAKFGYLIVLIGGNNCRIYRVEYNQAIVGAFLPVITDYWERFILARVLPEPDFKHPATFDMVKKLVGVNDTIMKIDEEGTHLYELAQRYELMRRVEKCAKEEKDSLKSQIIMQSGGAAQIHFPDGTKVMRKTTHRKAYTVKESSYETFNLTWKGSEQNGPQRIGVEPLKLGDGRPGEESGDHA